MTAPGPRCRGCKAPVKWITTKAGKPMICDPTEIRAMVTDVQPVGTAAARTVVVTEDGRTLTGWLSAAPGGREIRGYPPHWGSCPERDKFKRPEGERP